MNSTAVAVTNFTVTISTNGTPAEDYDTPILAENALDNAGNITAADCKVMGGVLTRGAIADGTAITQTTSLATGVCIHLTATQILIDAITGTPNSSGTWWPTVDTNDATNAWTPTDAGDGVAIVMNMYDNQGARDTYIAVDGFTTDADNTITFTAPVGERHNGTKASGAALHNTNPSYNPTIYILDDNVTVSWLRLRLIANQGGGTITFVVIVNNNVTFANNVCYDVINSDATYTCAGINFSDGDNIYIVNNIVDDFEENGLTSNGGNAAGDDHFVYNNTVYDCGKRGIHASGSTGTLWLKNNISVTNDGGDSDITGTWDNRATNGTEDATGEITGLSPSAEFTSITEGSENFHLKAGATSINAGTDLGTGVWSYDIDNLDRDTLSATWDLGADEVTEAAAATRNRYRMIF